MQKTCEGSETILFVEDEENILRVGKLLLEHLGYDVLTAQSGKEAIQSFVENMDKIDLVILDMIIPDMSGKEIFEKIRELNPDIKVLLSSGYSACHQAAEILQYGACGFIQKPYRIEKLSSKIRELI